MDKLPTSTGELTGFLHHRRITWQGTRGNRDWDAQTNWDGTNPWSKGCWKPAVWGPPVASSSRFSWKRMVLEFTRSFTWRMGPFSGQTALSVVYNPCFFFWKNPLGFSLSIWPWKWLFFIGVLAGMILQGGQFNCFLCYVLLFKLYNPKIP